MLSYKFRMYPNKEAQRKLADQLKLCAALYNHLLEEVNKAGEENRRITQGDTQRLITKLKKENPEFDSVYSKALQMVNNIFWYNIQSQNGLRRNGRKAGKLRYKAENSFKVLNYNQSGFVINTKAKKIEFSKLGSVNVKLNRRIEGKVKGITIKREFDNWFAIIQIDAPRHELPKTGKSVGIDLGVCNLIADSDGRIVGNPHFLDNNISEIRMAHRNLSRKKRDSKNFEKEKQRMGKRYMKINNRRKDFLHKLSRYYINNFDAIAIEDLDIKGLTGKGRGRTLHRNISDAAWRTYRDMLSYKAERAGRRLVFVNPKDTSQKCSRCGNVKSENDRLLLHDRLYKCKICGFESDRDYNASVNILKSGLGQPEVPLETLPLPRVISYNDINLGQVLSMNKETHVFKRG